MIDEKHGWSDTEQLDRWAAACGVHERIVDEVVQSFGQSGLSDETRRSEALWGLVEALYDSCVDEVADEMVEELNVYGRYVGKPRGASRPVGGDEEDEADEEDDDEEYIRAKGQELATAGLIGPNGRCTKKCKFMIRSSFMAVKEAFRDGSGDDDDDEDEWRRIGTPRSQQGRIRARHMLDCSHF